MKNGQPLSIHCWVVSLVHLFAYTSTYYLLERVQIPRYFQIGKYGLFALSLLVSTLVIICIWYLAMVRLSRYIPLHPTTLPHSTGMYTLEVIQMFVPGMILLAWESYNAQQDEEQRLHEIEKESLSNELKFLKAKLNPEFLFNTLDNLKTFVKTKSPDAPDVILRLSEVLDYVLYKSQKPKISLQEEVKVIKEYLALEKLRLGNKLNVNVDVSGDMTVGIVPLVLLSMIEHTVKESVVNQLSAKKASITIASQNNEVKCVVQYPKAENIVVQFPDFQSFIRQISLSYPNQHVFKQVESDDHISISTTLMLSELALVENENILV